MYHGGLRFSGICVKVLCFKIFCWEGLGESLLYLLMNYQTSEIYGKLL